MKRHRGAVLMTMGSLLLAAALALTGYNIEDDRRAEQTAIEALEAVQAAMPTITVDAPNEDAMPEEIEAVREMPEREVNGRFYIGTLEIPALDITLPVISQWSYADLKIAPCRYSGSAYQNDLILAAHNYSSHFGRLKELPLGTSVIFTDMNGQRFCYTVAQVETLAKTAVEDMETGEWDLTLFTCTLSGQSRLTIRCKRVEENN